MNQSKNYISVVHRMNNTNKPLDHINKIWFAIGSSVEVVMTFLPHLVKQVFRSLKKTDVSFNYIYKCTLTLKHRVEVEWNNYDQKIKFKILL